VEIFDIHTRQSVKRWRAHDGVINDMAFCPENARWLATTSGDDGVLKIWDITTERVLLSTNSSKGLWANLAFSLSGRLLVSGAPGATLNVWELRSMATEASLELLLKTNLAFLGPAAFAPDERTLAVCNRSVGHSAFDVGEYDLATGRVITFPKAHENLIECIAFSPDGSRLATGGADEHVVLWDPRKRVPIQTNATALINVMGLNFQDSQTLFASGWDQNIRCWDFQNPTEPLLLKGHAAGVNATAIALDGGTLASGGRDGTARLWNLRKEEMRSLAQPAEEFSTLLRSEDTASHEHGHLPVITSAVSPDQATVAAVTLENLIVCDVITGNRLATASATNIFRAQPTRLFGVAFSPDSRKLAVGSEDGSVVLLDATTLRSLNEPIQLHGNQITHIAFCLNGTVLATGGGFGTGVKLTELASGRVITNFSGVEGAYPIQAIAVSPDGKLLAMGSPEQVVYVRDIATGRILATSPQKVRLLHHVVFSPDGRLLAFSDEFGVIFLWDLSGQRSLANLIGHAGPVNALAFSPDGRTLASASMDHTIKLWHPEIDQEVATLTGHTAWVWSVLFAQQGDTLVSTSQDGTLKVWRALSFARLEAKAKIGNPLQ
jgi:WD40 repeat protein